MNMDGSLKAMSVEQKQLVIDNHAFAKRLSYRFMRRAKNAGYTSEDVESAAIYGLCHSALRYRLDAGTRFSTFAYVRICGEIRDMLRGKRRYYERLEMQVTADEANVPGKRIAKFEALVEAANLLGYDIYYTGAKNECECANLGRSEPEYIASKLSARQILQQAIDKLPRSAAYVIEEHYFKHRTMEEIREALGLPTRAGAFRIHASALKLLKRQLKRQKLGFADFLSLLN